MFVGCGPIGSDSVEHHETDDDEKQDRGPAEDLDEQHTAAAEAQFLEPVRQERDHGDGGQPEDDEPEGEPVGDGPLDEPRPALVDVVDDVDAVEESPCSPG